MMYECELKGGNVQQCYSSPANETSGNNGRCKLSRCLRSQLNSCDQNFINRKDHLYLNGRCCRCSWIDRYDDQFWNHKFGIPVYATRFDSPSPVKPPWCPPGCKTRSYLYPKNYKRNCDGWYPDQCRPRPKCFVKNPQGMDCGSPANFCGKKWTIPLCRCPLAGRSRCFPSPCECGCVPSPACVPKRLACCCNPENPLMCCGPPIKHRHCSNCCRKNCCGGEGCPGSNLVLKGFVPTGNESYGCEINCCDDFY